VHYICEPGTFVPIAQALRHGPIQLSEQPNYSSDYSLDDDPLWSHLPNTQSIDALAWYQCDHLGTPLEMTDQNGELAWCAEYKAWGEVREQRSAFAQQQGLVNPIRFQGQYHDHETGLHYNRYRYYDPAVGRFISKDPIGYAGGLNLYAYAPNPTAWIDPLGLTGKELAAAMNGEGTPTPPNSAAHHIVGEGSDRAKPARDILDDHKIPINSAANGVFLPNKDNKDDMPGILHCGRHPNAYIDTVNERVIEANTRGGKPAVLDELDSMRGSLSSADRNARWATVLDK
jgi:RHS repeat-associated protein